MNLTARLRSKYYRIRNSIGFYPAVIATGYFILANAVVVLDYSGVGSAIEKVLPWLKHTYVSSYNAILTTLSTGIISLTVLSFSMVMVVLSNTATSFSPKLLLGLVSEKSHQYVLGNYVGTIIYCLILMLATSGDKSAILSGVGVIIAALLGIWCIVLFFYFIHNISVSIQINNITQQIYHDTKSELNKQRGDQKENMLRWQAREQGIIPRYQYKSKTSGFFQTISASHLAKLAGSHDLVVRIKHPIGDFVVEGAPLFLCNKPADELDETVLEKIYGSFIFFTGEKIDVNYRYGFTQLMEIAIKALSPGINDPGTACICIDYLTHLLVLRHELQDRTVYYDDANRPRVIIPSFSFEALFNICISPIRRYGKGDLAIARQLLKCFETIALFDKDEGQYRQLLNEHTAIVIENVTNTPHTQNDLTMVNAILDNMKQQLDGYFDVHVIRS